MPISRIEQKRIETYARELFEEAKLEGREVEDLEQLKTIAMKLPREIIDLLVVMSQENDYRRLQDVIDEYQRLIIDIGGTVAADVTTAIGLDDELRKEIRTKLEKELGKPVYLVERVDPSIMGGIIINVEGERRDVSVRTQLQNVRTALKMTASYGGDTNGSNDR